MMHVEVGSTTVCVHLTTPRLATAQNVQGDMLVDYLSPVTALLLAYYFTNNIAFEFGAPFRTAGTVIGGAAFFAQLQQKLFRNLFAQIGPEVVCDFFCIMAERYWGMGEKADICKSTLA